ncbi:MAG: penicillin-insensitive murein endopeptidase [Oligoflexia bacterium]|nr:penicillin-insensitive murein endopeptidase [Oligoflexia bacterium]
MAAKRFMTIHIQFIGSLALMVAFWALPSKAQTESPWRRIQTPVSGEPRSIGEVARGCLQGAAELPHSGLGFFKMRLNQERGNRRFGHPMLVNLIYQLGQESSELGIGSLLIGDMALPRGGPSLTGHFSHQTGLDVDIYFLTWVRDSSPTPSERNELSAPSVVNFEEKKMYAEFVPLVSTLLQMTVSQVTVDRVFVNPIIKKEFCERLKPGERHWLRKVRPMWGHQEHFHVRLACPPGDKTCLSQKETLPPGDGCDQVSWWFSEDSAIALKKRGSPKMPALPAACKAVLQGRTISP